MEGEISIFQSIQLGVSRSLGSAAFNEANKSAMLRAEWTITARRAVLRFAQMKYGCFVPERCKQNAIFSGTSHQTGHVWIILRQTCDMLSVFSKGTAAAKCR